MNSNRILIVDDEELIRSLACAMLESAGYSCTTASSAQEAIKLLEGPDKFSLMISDLKMAGMSGLELLDQTRLKFPDLPIIMVTGVHDISVALTAIRRGAYDFLPKPFESEQLLAAARRSLEHRRLIIENRAYQTNLEALVAARTEQLRKAMQDLEQSYDITLGALGDALDLKDAETEGHCKRVTAFTVAMARANGLSSDKVRIIARGAFLHDLGKMAIPDAILCKPGKLNERELAIMREHSYRGYKMVCRIPFLQEAAEIVYAHQERWDGKGYPRGLRGEQIPLGARLFAVADTLDAICSDRPYRAAQPFSVARSEIVAGSGTQFDPAIVDVFLGLPETLWADLRREIETQVAKAEVHPTTSMTL
jgi:putative nucleotidyltransferase with HDIG domain